MSAVSTPSGAWQPPAGDSPVLLLANARSPIICGVRGDARGVAVRVQQSDGGGRVPGHAYRIFAERS